MKISNLSAEDERPLWYSRTLMLHHSLFCALSYKYLYRLLFSSIQSSLFVPQGPISGLFANKYVQSIQRVINNLKILIWWCEIQLKYTAVHFHRPGCDWPTTCDTIREHYAEKWQSATAFISLYTMNGPFSFFTVAVGLNGFEQEAKFHPI